MASIEQMSALIGEIYDCVVAPERWEATLAGICSETHFKVGALGTNALPSGEPLLFAAVGIAPDWLARMPGYGEEVLRLWGGRHRVETYPLDEPVVCSRVSDRGTWDSNGWYSEWARPQGLCDAVSIVLARDPAMVGNVTFGRHRSAGEISEDDLDSLRLLAPHIRRAVTIGKLLDLQTIAASTFESALQALCVSVVLVDADLGIVHANAAAEEMLKWTGPLCSVEGALTLGDAVATNALASAVAAARAGEASMGSRGLGIPVRCADGSGCVAHVLPLRQHLRGAVSQRAVAAVFVATASAPPRLPLDAVAWLYELTPAETRVFELIVDGHTQLDIAKALGIAPSTVKTHLLHVFEKTGCNRQAGLVKLAASMSLSI